MYSGCEHEFVNSARQNLPDKIQIYLEPKAWDLYYHSKYTRLLNVNNAI